MVAALLTASCSSAAAPPSSSSHSQSATASASGSQFPHVVVIVEENRSSKAVLGSAAAPYINQLASTYGVATASYGQAHPSLPNYLAMISGSTQGVTDDGTGYQFGAQTLASQLTAKGVDWRAYMEDMPTPCFRGATSGDYAKKHDPFMYFASISQTQNQCNRVEPYTQLSVDMSSATPPSFVWISPNLCNDGHDCSTPKVDRWLQTNLAPLLSSSWFAQDGVAILTWDEGEDDNSGCCNGATGGHIATVVISSRVHGHLVSSTPVDQAGLLRTLEEVYGLPMLGDAACACSGDLMSLIGQGTSATAPSSP